MRSYTPYSYVRRYYGVPAYVGVRVRVNGRDGELVDPRRDDQYVYVLFDGERKASGPWHPTDRIEYLPLTGTTATRSTNAPAS